MVGHRVGRGIVSGHNDASASLYFFRINILIGGYGSIFPMGNGSLVFCRKPQNFRFFVELKKRAQGGAGWVGLFSHGESCATQ